MYLPSQEMPGKVNVGFLVGFVQICAQKLQSILLMANDNAFLGACLIVAAGVLGGCIVAAAGKREEASKTFGENGAVILGASVERAAVKICESLDEGFGGVSDALAHMLDRKIEGPLGISRGKANVTFRWAPCMSANT